MEQISGPSPGLDTLPGEMIFEIMCWLGPEAKLLRLTCKKMNSVFVAYLKILDRVEMETYKVKHSNKDYVIKLYSRIFPLINICIYYSIIVGWQNIEEIDHKIDILYKRRYIYFSDFIEGSDFEIIFKFCETKISECLLSNRYVPEMNTIYGIEYPNIDKFDEIEEGVFILRGEEHKIKLEDKNIYTWVNRPEKYKMIHEKLSGMKNNMSDEFWATYKLFGEAMVEFSKLVKKVVI